MGGPAILLRQVFASKGQAMVADMAISLAVAGKTWDAVSLKQLFEALSSLEPSDSMKCKGRMARYSGP